MTSAESDTPASAADLTDSSVVRSPYAYYRSLRRRGPVHWSPTLFGGTWLVMDFDDVQAMFADWVRLSSARAHAIVQQLPDRQRARYSRLTQMHSRWMAFLDPPAHTRVRKVMNRGVAPAIRRPLTGIVRAQVDRLIDGFIRRGRAEIVGKFAGAVPLNTIATLIGLTAEDRSRLAAWISDIAAYVGLDKPHLETIDAAQTSMMEFEAYFRDIVRRRDEQPLRNDMLSVLRHARDNEELLSDEQVFAQCAHFAFTGNETTKNLIANCIYCLLCNPDQLRLLRQSPELVGNAVEETLRYESPVQFIGRIVRDDFSYRDARLLAGQTVVLMLGAANRDPDKNPQPDRFDILRPNRHLISFGHGIHACIGAALARLEARIAVARLFERCAHIDFADRSAVRWRGNPGLRGLERLDLLIGT